MKNIRIFVSENFQFLEVKVSIYLNRRIFVMISIETINTKLHTFINGSAHTPHFVFFYLFILLIFPFSVC